MSGTEAAFIAPETKCVAYLAAFVELQVNDVLNLVGTRLCREGGLNVLVGAGVQSIDLGGHVHCLTSPGGSCIRSSQRLSTPVCLLSGLSC